nr:uncharacterized protein LOC131798721 [Pocillopora verrucosa]
MLITHDFCEALAKRATEFIKFPETEQEVLQSIGLFTNKSPFPHVHSRRPYSHLSKLQREIDQGTWLNGPSKIIGSSEVGPLLVGDSAYPLSIWLMKPFKQTPTLTESQLRFNRALSQARVVIEQAFRILKGRWRCLYKPLEEKTSRVPTTIMACCVLHNICIDVGDPSAIDPVEDDDEMDQSSCNGDEQSDARGIREDIMNYLS